VGFKNLKSILLFVIRKIESNSLKVEWDCDLQVMNSLYQLIAVTRLQRSITDIVILNNDHDQKPEKRAFVHGFARYEQHLLVETGQCVSD